MLKIILKKKEYYYNMLQHLIEIGASAKICNDARVRYFTMKELCTELTAKAEKLASASSWWSENVITETPNLYSKDKIYNAEHPIKGSLPANAIDEEYIRPLTTSEDADLAFFLNAFCSRLNSE